MSEVTAITHRSDKSGADLTDAALMRCGPSATAPHGASVSLSGGCSWPGNEHGEHATGKHFDIKSDGQPGVSSPLAPALHPVAAAEASKRNRR